MNHYMGVQSMYRGCYIEIDLDRMNRNV